MHRPVAFPASISPSCLGKTHQLGDCAVELGLWHCALGILIFSGSMPATRVSVEGFSSLFLPPAGGDRGGVVGAMARAWPARRDLSALAIPHQRHGGGLPAGHRASSTVDHLATFHRFYRAFAIHNGDRRRTAQRRAAPRG